MKFNNIANEETDKFEMMSLFPKPVFLSNIFIDNHIKDYVERLEYYQMSNASGKLTNNTYILEDEIFNPLKNQIVSNIKSYMHKVLAVDDSIEFYITNSWVTLHEHGDLAQPHTHSNSLISGTLYINIPKDDDSLFQFHSPDSHKLFGMFQPKVKSFNSWNGRVCSVKPETGTLILFPSDLSHSTTEMTSKTDNRYCLAFNVFLKGDISNQEDSNKGSINRVII
jgi:uncharacterized protein (TIGR02466 family)